MCGKRMITLAALLAILATLWLPTGDASAQSTPPFKACATGAFSTEEDFIMTKGEPFDGNPYISDGDMLSFNGQVCMRNHHLLAAWFAAAPGPDLGLDALDILDIDKPIVAFSTELDDPGSRFTAGDLLFTTGAAIPNVALMYPFGVRHDVGLDGVQFIGAKEKILQFVAVLVETPRGAFVQNPGLLQQLLKRFAIDIWFTIEGTMQVVGGPSLLDGDLLSAATGTIVISQSALLPADVPAGLPNRGVDFGLDGVATPRDPEQARKLLAFSTEILYEGEKTKFTDGDVLRLGDGIIIPNWDLIKKFYPAADFLGLDALSAGEGPGPTSCENQITDIGGLQVDVADINPNGRAEIGYATDHPFGANVPVWGTICNDVARFRVVFRKTADGPGTGTGIPVVAAEGWKVKDRNWITGACTETVNWFSDADGWYDGPTFRSLLFCNPNLILTNWKSGSAPDPNTQYNIWLEFDRGAGIETEPSWHPVRLDNKQVDIANMSIPGGSCVTYGPADMPFMVQGDINDDHFWGYQLLIGGNLYPYHYYSRANYYDAVPAAAHLDSTGTTPAGLQDLHKVTVFDLAPSPVRCAYGVTLLAWDRTIDGAFVPAFNNVGGNFRSSTLRTIFFDYAP